MDDTQNLSGQGQDDLALDAMEAVGVGEPTEDIVQDSDGSAHMQGDGNSGKDIELPVGVKERLGRQEKRHQRELRQMRAQMEEMQQMMTQQPPMQNESEQMNGGYGQGNPEVNDQIHQAVRLALHAQEEQKRKMKEREDQEHVNKRYQSLHENLDKGSDKFEDFEDVVRAQDAPFTAAMRDAALFLDNPAEVLYKLGKDKDELTRISKLHPVDQARAMVKLSHALMTGGGNEKSNSSHKPIGNIKSNPVNHSSVNDKTPVGDIRRRMKAGEWKSNR